jgi:hypothetical protein
MTAATEWSSLEVVKLIVAAMTPVLVFGLGFMVTRAARRLEEAQWADRKLIERRLELYDKLAPPLNDLFCFFTTVGHFRDITPPDALDRKREADKVFHVNRYLFSPEFGDRYTEFMDACFKQYVGAGKDALLRTSADHQRNERGKASWPAEWTEDFVTEVEEQTPLSEIRRMYDALMHGFSRQVGAQHTGA